MRQSSAGDKPSMAEPPCSCSGSEKTSAVPWVYIQKLVIRIGSYDNRPGTDLGYALPDYTPKGLLLPFAEGNASIFRCPRAIEWRNTPATRIPQVSYAWNGVTNGPAGKKLSDITNASGTSHVSLVWDHARGPSCWRAIPINNPRNKHWNDPALDMGFFHYPVQWHGGVCNFLFCDGHVEGIAHNEIRKRMFYLDEP
jgi:prepilin-type processing-associated H-X9-DG protein